MEKSLGNKRRRIGDPQDKAKDPDHIAEITRIYESFQDGETRTFLKFEKLIIINDGPYAIRTRYLLLRRQSLYPGELMDQTTLF